MRGNLNKNCFVNYDENDPNLIHYWVEAKGMVYDNGNMQVRIMPIKDYYKLLGVVDVEYATDGIFNKNNIILESGPETDEMLEKYTLDHVMIERYKS